MQNPKLPFLRLLLNDQLRTSRELKERNSALYDLTIDQGIVEMKNIEHTERELELINQQIELTANLGFYGFSHRGGLTQFFFGYPDSNLIHEDRPRTDSSNTCH